MYSIICDCDLNSQARIVTIRDDIKAQCPGGAFKTGLEPHISLQGADDYPIEQVELTLREVTEKSPPVKVYVGGLGIFTGDSPVVYLTIAKSRQLYEVHRAIWEELSGLGQRVNPLFSPTTWIPHISLFYGKKTDLPQLSCVIGELMEHDLNFEITIVQLSIVFDKAGELGIRSSFSFREEE